MIGISDDRNFLFDREPPRPQIALGQPPLAAVPRSQGVTGGNGLAASASFGRTISDMYLLCQPGLDFQGRDGNLSPVTVRRLLNDLAIGWVEGNLFRRWISSGWGMRLFP